MTQSWLEKKLEVFDKKFDGYWRGQAIPDEIKFFISSLLQDFAKEVSEEIDKLPSPYFLRSQGAESEGPHIIKSDVLKIINRFKS